MEPTHYDYVQSENLDYPDAHFADGYSDEGGDYFDDTAVDQESSPEDGNFSYGD